MIKIYSELIMLSDDVGYRYNYFLRCIERVCISKDRISGKKRKCVSYRWSLPASLFKRDSNYCAEFYEKILTGKYNEIFS